MVVRSIGGSGWLGRAHEPTAGRAGVSDRVGSEGFSERTDGLLNGGCRSLGDPLGVEHHEVVGDEVVAHTGGGNPGLDELAGVRFALVAEHVVLVDDDQRRGQAAQVVEGGLQRGRGDLRSPADVGEVGVQNHAMLLARRKGPSAKVR